MARGCWGHLPQRSQGTLRSPAARRTAIGPRMDRRFEGRALTAADHLLIVLNDVTPRADARVQGSVLLVPTHVVPRPRARRTTQICLHPCSRWSPPGWVVMPGSRHTLRLYFSPSG